MLRPASLTSLLATLVAIDRRSGSGSGSGGKLQPHTAILSLVESAEVYAFSTSYSPNNGNASGAVSSSRHAQLAAALLAEESTRKDAKSIAAQFARGLMVEHGPGAEALDEDVEGEEIALGGPDSLEGEERIQALAAVATMAWREEVERIQAQHRRSHRASRSASGSTAAESSSGRTGGQGPSQQQQQTGSVPAGAAVPPSASNKGKSRAGGRDTGPANSETGRSKASSSRDPSGHSSVGPTIALPGTRVIQQEKSAQAAGSTGLVPLLLDCEVSGAIRGRLVVASKVGAQRSSTHSSAQYSSCRSSRRRPRPRPALRSRAAATTRRASPGQQAAGAGSSR